MFKLITKQGFLNIKKHWNLYLPYFFFLFFSFWILLAFFGFVFNFDTLGHQIINPRNYPSYSLKLFNYGFDNENGKKIKIDQKNSQDLWSFFVNKYPEQDPDLLRELVIKSGQQNGYLKETDFDQSQTEIRAELNKYNNNLLISWLYESELFLDKKVLDRWTGFDRLVSFEIETKEWNSSVNFSTFKIEDWNNNFQINIKEWQKYDYIDEFYWIEKREILEANRDDQVIINPKFADYYNLKIGDTLTVKISPSENKTLKIIGLAIKRSRSLVDNSHDAYLSPLLYNEIIKNNTEAWMLNLDVATNFKATKNQEYDQFYQSQFKKYETILSKYFENLDQKPFGELKKISTSTIGSFETQLFVYYFLASTICLILLILVIVIYLIISQNNIQNQKEQISFLKSLGTNNSWLSYYILIMVLPFILLAFILATGLTNFMYRVLIYFTLNSIGFDLQQQAFNNWKLIFLLCFLVFLITLISYLIVFLKIKKFNFFWGENQSHKFVFYQKIPKIFVGQIQNKTITLKNIGTSGQLFLISLFTFLSLGITWQFLASISVAAQSNQKFFTPYRSYSYQILKEGQINYEEKITEDKLLKSTDFSELEKIDFSNSQQLIEWGNKIYHSQEDISHKYFNQVQEFSNPLILTTIKKVKDEKIRENLLKFYDLVINELQIYHDYFGLSAPTPIINFKYAVFPNTNYWFSSIFKTNINNRLVTTYTDQKFDQQVSSNHVVINYLLAHDLNLKVGDSVKIKYLNLNTNQEQEIVKIIERIETKINDGYQIILNSAIISQWLINQNAIFSQEDIPVGLKYLTVPVMQNDGHQIQDYWDLNQEKWNDFNLNISSFSLLNKEIYNQASPYLNLLIIISFLMILITFLILILVGLIFARENKQEINLLKIIGYSFKNFISSIILLFSISLILAWTLASLLSIIIIHKSKNLLLSKILIEINPILNFETLGINLIVAFLILTSIIIWIYILYKKSGINNYI